MTKAQIVPARMDKFIPYIFVLMFAVIFVVNGLMVFFAIHTQTGVISESAYEQGIGYNDIIAAKEAQDKLHWGSQVSFKDGKLVFVLKDEQGRAILGGKVTALVKREIQDGSDFTVVLQPAANGVYETALNMPAKGQWQVRIFFDSNDIKYQTGTIIFVD